jgi:hypothetical protein
MFFVSGLIVNTISQDPSPRGGYFSEEQKFIVRRRLIQIMFSFPFGLDIMRRNPNRRFF